MINCETVTFGVIAFNEQKYLPDLLDDLLNQKYTKNLIEVILVDGESNDDTLSIMKSFQKAHAKEYRDIKVFTNPKRIQPAGWNVVIKNASSDILLRIDAHARLPKDFIEKNVACINSGEVVCGGPRENIIDEDVPWKRMLLTAEQSMFGSGIASYRQKTKEKKYVKSLFHGAYKKEVIDKVGLFNESLVRTEDNEYHYRIRQAGYRICYDPDILSYYQTRNSLATMLRQKYQNGFWIGKTIFVCPKCISIFHLVPFAFVLAIVLTILLGCLKISWPMLCLWGAYGIVNITMTLLVILSESKKSKYNILLPVIFFLLHFIYGVGTINGIIKGCFFKQ